jgi:hypothetical protein
MPVELHPTAVIVNVQWEEPGLAVVFAPHAENSVEVDERKEGEVAA